MKAISTPSPCESASSHAKDSDLSSDQTTDLNVNAADKPKRSKTKTYCYVIGSGFLVIGLAFGIKAFLPEDKHLIPTLTEATAISDNTAKVSSYDRSNFNSTADHIQDLQRSIPKTNKIKAFNGAYLSSSEINNIKHVIKEFTDYSYDVSFVMMNVKTGKGVAYNTNELFYSASAIKAPYIASLLAKGELNEDRKTHDYLNQQIESILLWSDNDAYLALDEHYDTYAFQPWGVQAGLDHSLDLEYCYLDFTSADLAKMWLQIYADYENGYIDDDISDLATRPETSSIRSVLGDADITWSKAGWIPDGDRFSATNDAGIIKTKDSTYVMAICSNAPSNFDLVDDMVATLSELENALL